MPDPLRIEPHPDGQRSYAELREQYRSENLQRIRGLLSDYRINGVKMKMMGRPLSADGFSTPALRAQALLAALDDPVVQDFGLDQVSESQLRELDDLLKECGMFEKVTWAEGTEGVVDHDGPPLPIAVEEMTEKEQLDYVQRAIEESKKDG